MSHNPQARVQYAPSFAYSDIEEETHLQSHEAAFDSRLRGDTTAQLPFISSLIPDGAPSLLRCTKLTVEGPFYDSAKPDGNVGSLAITGGTGRYAGARGWMGLYNRPAPTQEYDFVYCLLE